MHGKPLAQWETLCQASIMEANIFQKHPRVSHSKMSQAISYSKL